MKNKSTETRPLKRTNVVYKFKCPIPGCPETYVGMTTMTLSKRISCHSQEGNIFAHFMTAHNSRPPTRDVMTEAFEIIDCETNTRKLQILEALHIAKIKPSINITQEPFLLPSCVAPRQRLQPANQ